MSDKSFYAMWSTMDEDDELEEALLDSAEHIEDSLRDMADMYVEENVDVDLSSIFKEE